MNVLTNLMAMLSPGAAAKGAGGQAIGEGGDFSALFAQMGAATATSPIALSIPATDPNAASGAALAMAASPVAALDALADTVGDLTATMPTEDAPTPVPTEQMLQAAIPLAVKGLPLRAKPGVEVEDAPSEAEGEAEAGETAESDASKPKGQPEISVSAPILAMPVQIASNGVAAAAPAVTRRTAESLATPSPLQAPAPPAVSIQPRTPAAAGEPSGTQATVADIASTVPASDIRAPSASPAAPLPGKSAPQAGVAPAAPITQIPVEVQQSRSVQAAAPLAQPSFAADTVRAVMGTPRAAASPTASPTVSADVASIKEEPLADATALLQLVTGGKSQSGKTTGISSKPASASSMDAPATEVRPSIARGNAQRSGSEPSVDQAVDKKAAPIDVAANLTAVPTSFHRAMSPASIAPATDLSASLGQQVIDMSSGGQWVDGLAREIASMAAGTGQGSFRLSPPNLGPMHVAISQGDAGMAIKLTVETTAAETALKQDSGQLKVDAQLAALRVSDVTVERVHRVHEPSATDTSSQGNAGQNGQSNFSQQGNWGGGQAQSALAQGQNQSGGQSGRKSFSDNAVSSQGDTRDQGAEAGRDDQPRARYA